jgi:hypothetical protein
MRFGIVGLPRAGKSTLFNMLTHGSADLRAWGGHDEVHVGVARVPDPRLDRLAEITRPRKVTHATMEYVDLPAISRQEGARGDSEPWAAGLAALKNAEALVHVVRAFDDDRVPHPEGTVDPARDIRLLELEMVLLDLSLVERRLERLSKDLKKIKSAELEREHEVLARFRAVLERERPLRELELSEEEQRLTRGFTFLSAKPLLVVLNLGDDQAATIPRVVDAYGLESYAGWRNTALAAVCGKIEAEIAALPPQDARAFMEDLGLPESGPARVIARSYSLLRLVSFYTVSESEARAWAVPEGTPALKAAGMIHTDFERGFIKAEVVRFEDMLAAGSFQAARSKGLLRIEGKDYPIQDADVVLFRFHV